MSRYARNTTVATDRSIGELKKIVQNYGGGDFAYVERVDMAIVAFKMNKRTLQYKIDLPPRDDRKYTHTESRGSERHSSDARKLWEKDCRQKWRVLVLLVKATFEAIENDLMSFDQAFMSSIVLKNGQTLGDRFLPELDKIISTGTLPLMITAGKK